MKRSPLILLTLGIATAAVAAPGSAFAADAGTVRFLHGAPGAPAVDIWVNGSKAVSALGRGKITPYLDLAPGTYRYAIRPAGSPKVARTVVLAGSVRIVKDRVWTIAVTDRIARRGLKVRVIQDTGERPFGSAKVRVAHLSADTPAVDVVVAGAGKVVSKLRFPSRTPYLTLPEGKYTFFVRPAGTRINAITLRNVRVKAGNIYTAWAVGALTPRRGEFTLRGLLTRDALPSRYDRTQLRVLHASPGAPPVDVYVNGAKAIPNLPFATAAPDDGSYLKLPSGPAAVAIRPAGAAPASAPVFAADLTLPPQATITAAARGQLAGPSPFGVSTFVDDVSPTSGKSRVTVAHLSPDAPAVDVYANASDTSGAPALTGLTFPNASTPIVVPPATYTFGVTAGGSKTVVLPVGPATLPADSATVVYAIGLLGGTPALAAKALTTTLG